MNETPDTLSSIARYLTWATAVLFGILGLVLFIAPGWAAPNFLWNISPFVAMTMGGWYLGSAFFAWESARVWRWPVVYACLAYLWAFGLLEALVLVAHSNALKLGAPLGWPYMIVIGVSVLAALAGLLVYLRQRPSIGAEGPPVPMLLRIASGIFVLFVWVLAIIGPGSFGLDGSVFPEPLTPFTVYAFAAFYFSLGVGALVLIWAKGLVPVVTYARVGLALIIPITIAAFVFLGLFNFGERPGGLLYFAAYIVVGIAAAILVVNQRARPGAVVSGSRTQ